MVMSACGPKHHEIGKVRCPRSGAKRTWLFALQMSANDPKRALAAFINVLV